jgi:hypothetical protein
MAEVCLDASKALRFGAAAQPTGRYDRHAGHATCDLALLKTLKGSIIARNETESGECRVYCHCRVYRKLGFLGCGWPRSQE